MNKIWMAAMVGTLGLVGAPAMGGDAPARNEAVLRARLKGALGSRWSVVLKDGAVVAERMRPQTPAANMKSQVDEREAKLSRAHQAMTVAVENGQARFAGETNECDAIVDSAREFAQIRGINELVLDARCRSR